MLTLAVAATMLTLPWNEQIALARADFASYGPAARYLDFGTYHPDAREDADLAWRFYAPHVVLNSSLSQELFHLDRTTLYRVDVDAMGWGVAGWTQALKNYPYHGSSHDGNILIARVDWLLAYGADASRTTTGDKAQTVYFSLLFGGKPPKNKTELLAAFGLVEKKTGRERAQVIDDSGVAFGRRLYVHHKDVVDWDETYDSARPVGVRDPALGVDAFKAQAQELIFEIMKVLPTGTREEVRIQAYALTNAETGAIIAVATNDIVEDFKRFGNRASVRNPGSCIQCHTAGINGSNSNAFVDFLKLPGVPTITVKDVKQQTVFDPLYLSSLGKYRKRANEDVAAWTLEYLQTDPRGAVDAWVRTVEIYDEDLDLAQVAREMYAAPNDLRLALGYFSSVKGPLPQYMDVAGLAHGGKVSRLQFEDVGFGQCFEAMKLWRAKH